MEIRPIGRSEWPEAIRLVNEVFREPDERTMELAFPRSFSEALGQSFGVFEEGRLVAFMGLVPSVVRIGPASISAYQLGQVCTRPGWEGRGYANALMDQVMQHAVKSGASLMFVSGARGLYTRYNCLRYGGKGKTSIGLEQAARLRQSQSGAPEPAMLREAGPTDWFELHRLDRMKAVRFERSLWDLADLIASAAHANCKRRRHRVYVAERQAGEAAAYIVLSTPRDGCDAAGASISLIEWGGEADCAASLIAHAIDQLGVKDCEVGLPWQERELAIRLEQAGCTFTMQQMPGTLCVLQAQRFYEQLLPYYHWTEAGRGARPRSMHADGSVTMDTGTGYAELSAQMWIDWLFQPPGTVLEPHLAELERHIGRFPVPLPDPSGLNYV